MVIEYWLINGKDKLRLPVNPPSLQYSSPFAYDETFVAGLGDTTSIGYRGLRDFTIETFWPATYNSVYCSYSSFIAPMDFVAKIESWRSKRAPIQFVVTGIKGVNYKVTIRDFTVETEQSGSPGDVYFTLALKEYRAPAITTVDLSKKAKISSKSRPSKAVSTPPKKYTVKSGDSLWKIAVRVYHDGTKMSKIYNANKKVIGKNPNNIKPGQSLVIPK